MGPHYIQNVFVGVFVEISAAKDFNWAKKPSENNEEAFKRSTKDGFLLPGLLLLLRVPGGKNLQLCNGTERLVFLKPVNPGDGAKHGWEITLRHF